ncbi:hypothetical protein [Mycolicibacter minnesotensis]
MEKPPRSYTRRRALIADKLEPYFRISEMVPVNQAPTSEIDKQFWDNSLWCMWADRDTGGLDRTVAVAICQVEDGAELAGEIRDMIGLECSSGIDLSKPNSEAYEYRNAGERTYVFVLGYLHEVRAIVNNCYANILVSGDGADLDELADAAVEIIQALGCSAYENDFRSPDLPDEWRDRPAGWTVEGGPPYIPGSVEPESE